MVLNKQQFILALLILSIQQGIWASENYKSFIKEHPFISGMVTAGVAWYGMYKIRQVKTCKKLDEARKEFNEGIKKGNKKIKAIGKVVENVTTNVNNTSTSFTKLNDCYKEMTTELQDIKETVTKEGNKILENFEKQQNCINNISSATKETGGLISQHVKNTNEIKDQIEDIKEMLSEVSLN